MRSSAFAVALLAVSAVASPIHKVRDLVTDIVVVTETYYVTEGGYRQHPHSETSVTTVTANPVAQSMPPSYVQVTEYQPPPPKQTQAAPSPAASVESVPSKAPAPAPSSPPVSTAPTGNYETDCVNAHNVHRSNHSAGPVDWDATLAGFAATTAATCVWAHDLATGGGGYGQNILVGTNDTPDQVGPAIHNQWYNNELMLFTQYGVATPSDGVLSSAGHFTQMVWKGTSHIGCATQHCPNGLANLGSAFAGSYFTVCNYRNTGNVKGSFDQNVGQPLGQPVVK